MAKEKTYAVTVEYTVTRTLFIEARRPKTASERALSDEGWREATRWDEDAPYSPPAGAKIVNVRQT